uniref:Protein kinase domain-containing protein n=1 Tax=Trypanosoma congolense (strain IL3000) TaxID=1068625 RepID=G0UNP7_TRYCI|nr:putative protein kinase [Trypanosoma congolense IL3000]
MADGFAESVCLSFPHEVVVKGKRPIVSAFILQPCQAHITDTNEGATNDSDVSVLRSAGCVEIPVKNLTTPASEKVIILTVLLISGSQEVSISGWADAASHAFFPCLTDQQGDPTITTVSISGKHCIVEGECDSCEKEGDLLEERTAKKMNDSPEGDSSAVLVVDRSCLACGNAEADQDKAPETFSEAKPSFFDENFEVLLILGRGASGVALLTRHRVSAVLYAVKVVLVRDKLSEEAVLQEVRLHAMLDNEHIVRYYTCWSEVATPGRLQQLASVGLCSEEEVKYAFNSIMAYYANDKDYKYDAESLMRGYNGFSAPRLLLQARCGEGGGAYMEGYDTMDGESESSTNSTTATTRDDEEGSDSGFSDKSSSERSLDVLSRRVVFIQLEYYQTTLASMLGSRSCIDRLENIFIGLQLLSAVRYVHRVGFLHRDVKPQNIFIDYRAQLAVVDNVSDEEDDEDYSVEVEDKNGWTCCDVQDGGVSTRTWSGSLDFVDSCNVSRQQQIIRSVFEFLLYHASKPPLSTYLNRVKCAQHDFEKRTMIDRIGRWVCNNFLRLRLGDFSISKSFLAQHVDLAGNFGRTAMNTMGIGSSLYSSPEQLEGELCTSASDAYSVGVVFAEMYIQPKTVSERLSVLNDVRKSVFPEPGILLKYPELCVVRGLTRSNASQRMSISEARRTLRRTMCSILLSFFSEA